MSHPNMSVQLPVGNHDAEAEAQQRAQHEAAMIAKSEGVTIGGQPTEATSEVPQRPENVPEKFWDAKKGEVNVKALLKAQQDAEDYIAKLRGQPPKTEDPKPEAVSAEAPSPQSADPVSAQAAIDEARREFAESGQLTEETFAKLAEQGLPRAVVEGYMASAKAQLEQQAQFEAVRKAAFDAVGGEQTFNEARTWAVANMAAGEIAAINKLLEDSDPSVVAAGAKMLGERYRSSPREPAVTLKGATGQTSTSNGFRSRQEMIDAMSDRRYHRDEAYRDEVIRRLAQTDDKTMYGL